MSRASLHSLNVITMLPLQMCVLPCAEFHDSSKGSIALCVDLWYQTDHNRTTDINLFTPEIKNVVLITPLFKTPAIYH
jgi:hypothetical protein